MTSRIEKMYPPQGQNKIVGLFLLFALVLLVVVLAVWQMGLLPLSNLPTAGDPPESPQALWEAQDIDSYRYNLTLSCFCFMDMTRPVTILVENGEVSSITYIDDGTSADPLLFNGFSTIDQLYERLAEREAENPVKFDVIYDQEYSVPLSVDIDVSELIADEELRLTVSNFEPLR